MKKHNEKHKARHAKAEAKKAQRAENKRQKHEARGTLKEQFNNLCYAYKFIWKANKKIFFYRIPLLVIQSIKTVVPIFFVREILNEITVGKRFELVFAYAFAMAAVSFILSFIELILSRCDSVEHSKLDFEMQKLLAKSVTDMSYATLEDPVMHDYIWLAQENRFNSVLQFSANIVGSFLTVFGIGAVVLTLNPIILAVIAATSVVKYITDYKLKALSYNHSEEWLSVSRENRYYMTLMSDVQMGKEARVNNLESWIYNGAQTSWKNTIYPFEKKHLKKIFGKQNISSAISIVQDIAIYLILALEVIYSSMTVGDFSMYLSAAGTFSSCIIGISSNWSNLILQTSGYLRDYRKCLDFAKQQKEICGHTHIEAEQNAEIEFRDVSFMYPRTDRMILEHINITIKRGETLSIVGVNGAGKTTFVRLLCRFYEPTEGEIFINGIPAKDIPLEEYYRLIGVVFQDFSLFSFTVAENISMDTECDNERLNDAIRKSGLEGRIKTLPHGTDTYLYKEFDPDGIELSGGEGQKVAIARAVYRNSPIVIFDEPTSALDPIAEYNIYRNFHELANGRTSIYISHRLSSTRFTDKIAVFANATIAEYGTHNELISLEDGIYKKMFSAQAKYYEE